MTGHRHPSAVDVNGEQYLPDARGNLTPIATIKASDLLMDETVRAMISRAQAQSDTLAAFKADAFDRVQAFMGLLAQSHGATLGGKKGNITLTTFDGMMKVQVAVADLFEFGPELQPAKALIDECLTEWASGSGAELRTIVNRAFSVEKEGQINRAELFMLLRSEIADPRWKRAMDAIRESMRIVGSKEYIRFYRRDRRDGPWKQITLDLASA